MATHESRGPLKRTLLLVSATLCLSLALAGTAFAAGVNHSGQLRFGAASPAPGMVPSRTTGLPELVDGAGTYTYIDWSLTLGTNGDKATSGSSPHGNYTTSTIKCAVCHSVHYAAPADPSGAAGDYTVASGNASADTLLRMRAANACFYCHATTGTSAGAGPVYDGDPSTPGHPTGDNCGMCHSSIHGDPTDTSVASLSGYLLKLIPQDSVGPRSVPTTTMLDAMTVIDDDAQAQGYAPGEALGAAPSRFATDFSPVLREQAVGIFCAGCHEGAYATVAPGVRTNVLSSTVEAYTGHRIAASASAAWNATGSVSSGALRNAEVAWKPAVNCKSCHDAKGEYGQDAFPHGWGGTKMWLLAAPSAGSSETTLPYGTDPGSGYDENRPQLSDGVCLKCHVAPGDAGGVGISY